MKKFVALCLCTVMLLPLFVGCGSAESSATEAAAGSSGIEGVFSVGYGEAEITVREPISLAGFSDASERISNTIMDSVYATCAAITDEDGVTVLLFGLDLLASDGTLTKNLRRMLNERTGIPEENIQFFASHTHSSMHQGGSSAAVAKGNELFKEKCMEAAEMALKDRKPAQMEATFTRPVNLNYRRHYVLTDGTYRAYELGLIDHNRIYGHLGEADNLLQMVKFTREGGCDVMMVNWQAHYASATNVNYYGISADYPGILRKELKAQLGCETVFFLGGAGNVTSGTRLADEPSRENYVDQGQQLAAAVVEASANFKPIKTGKIVVTHVDHVFEGSEKINPLFTLGFGEFGCAFAPFEIFDMHAQAVREASPYKYTFYASCGNSSRGNSYLPHEASFDYYCYEADVTHYPKGTGEALRDQLIRMLEETFQKSGQEPQTREDGYLAEPYVPKTNGKTYTNPAPGALPIEEGVNGYYCVTVLCNSNMAPLLFKDRALAEQIAAMDTFQLLFDDYNTVVGIVQ